MSLPVIKEIWSELKRFVNTVDRDEAAEILVGLLIDHDEDPEDIREEFKGDSDVKRALAAYMDQHDDTDEDEYEDYDDPEEEDY